MIIVTLQRLQRGIAVASLMLTGCGVSRADVAASGIPNLTEALDSRVITGRVIHVQGPPSDRRDSDTLPGTSRAFGRSTLGARKGPGTVFQSLRARWLSTQHPDAKLEVIAGRIRDRYEKIVLNRVDTPNVTHIDVEPMTLVYPSNYYENTEPITVHLKRLSLRAGDRILVAYYANYDRIQLHDGAVILQINGHFGLNPSRQGLGLDHRGGASGAALGKIAMQHLPLLTYDDHNEGESSNASPDLPRTLENMQMIDRALLTHFKRVDGLGLSGGTERWYHFSVFFQCNVQSVYYAGFAMPLWTRLDPPHFGSDRDTHDELFIRNFQYADLALVGIYRIPHVAFAHNAGEAGGSKYGYFEEMVPIIRQYTDAFETRGGDRDGDGISDTGRDLAHEYDLLDYFAFLDAVRGASSSPAAVRPKAE